MNQFGFGSFWEHSDGLSHAVALILLMLSITSWYLILSKAWQHSRLRKQYLGFIADFWQTPNWEAATQLLEQRDSSRLFTQLAKVGQQARELAGQRLNQEASHGLAGQLDMNDHIIRSLRQQLNRNMAKLEVGQTLLASIASTTPFIGLFGTVWGIYHALVGLAGSTTVVLDKVAGPVGEALIMTAAGLFVAIPAVMAYNLFTRSNRLILAEMEGFAHDLHAALLSGRKAQS